MSKVDNIQEQKGNISYQRDRNSKNQRRKKSIVKEILKMSLMGSSVHWTQSRKKQ